ncbi:MAG TPA: peptidylprolyl isomerase, partial [Blastocatellia bacterium]|nr:peptidylprolyl isomerase [Blastocatellia bacterium]
AGAEQKIKSLYDRLEQHTDFATLASQQSEEQRSAMNGGRLGFASEAMIKQSFPTVPNLAETLMAMSAGQHTKPLKDEATGAWYIFQVNDKLEQSRNLTFEDARQTIVNTLTQQRQQVLWNAVLMLALSEANVKNYLAERIVQNPKVIVDMRPSQLLESGGQPAPAQQQPQPRFEDEAQSTNSSRAASANANKPAANANRRPATPNAN